MKLINAADIRELLKYEKKGRWKGLGYRKGYTRAINDVLEGPHPVYIVRCHECRHYTTFGRCGYEGHKVDHKCPIECGPNDFCSKGETRGVWTGNL